MFPYSDADIRHDTFPIVNVALIGINVLVFIYEVGLGGFGVLFGNGNQDLSNFFFKWGFIPLELTLGEAFSHPGFDVKTPLPTSSTYLSSMFIHGGLFHLAGNMMFLWVFGDNIEDRIGHLKYLVFYLVAGVGAALAHLAVDPYSQIPLVGASGAISGVMGAYMLLFPFNRIKTLIVIYIITAIEVRAVYLLGAWFVWQLIQGLLSVGVSKQVDIAFFAHVGGFVAGVLIMAMYKVATKQSMLPERVRGKSWDDWYRTRN